MEFSDVWKIKFKKIAVMPLNLNQEEQAPEIPDFEDTWPPESTNPDIEPEDDYSDVRIRTIPCPSCADCVSCGGTGRIRDDEPYPVRK